MDSFEEGLLKAVEADIAKRKEGVQVTTIESQVEIVSHLANATLKSHDDKLKDCAQRYGDLVGHGVNPIKLMEKRKVEEDKWFSPQCEIQRRCSSGLVNANNCIVYGTNGNYAFAVHCFDDDGKGDSRLKLKQRPVTLNEKAEAIHAALGKQAENNRIMLLKQQLASIECDAFESSMVNVMQNECKTEKDLKAVLKVLDELGKLDNNLRDAGKNVGPYFMQCLKKIRAAETSLLDAKDSIVYNAAERPGNFFLSLSLSCLNFFFSSYRKCICRGSVCRIIFGKKRGNQTTQATDAIFLLCLQNTRCSCREKATVMENDAVSCDN
jgi:hypothetical protein